MPQRLQITQTNNKTTSGMTEPSHQEPAEQLEKTDTTNNKWIHYLALFIVSIGSAWAAGRMIGISQHDSIVIAAVVPVLLSAGWAIISLKFANLDHKNLDDNLIAIAVAAMLFLYIISVSAHLSHQDEKNSKLSPTYREYIENCSLVEFYVNESRAGLGLPPLESKYFCKK